MCLGSPKSLLKRLASQCQKKCTETKLLTTLMVVHHMYSFKDERQFRVVRYEVFRNKSSLEEIKEEFKAQKILYRRHVASHSVPLST
ncbi:hypothetical protein EVAR_55156_1 [Eumeta japonica]|uniref:Uncharacterized protein n=1 Tax=Eumeta variegata TaxID=151549 RepID=A0A4C1Y9S1_EUMVA|nr:hypothetical protein EVAR_55156_1 [Eumeta japonica]